MCDVPQNDSEAVKWFRLVANQGIAGAQLVLGSMYHEGRGAPQNDAEAMQELVSQPVGFRVVRIVEEEMPDHGIATRGRFGDELFR